MKASTTAWPPLVTTGLLMLLLTTSTDMPRSTRMPLVSFEFFTVILYNIIVCIYWLFYPCKKSVRLNPSSPSSSRYRQTPFTNEPKNKHPTLDGLMGWSLTLFLCHVTKTKRLSWWDLRAEEKELCFTESQ